MREGDARGQRLRKLRESLEEIEQDAALRDPARYVDRVQATELLELEFEGGLAEDDSAAARALVDRAMAVRRELEDVDEAIVSELRERIRTQRCAEAELMERLRRICDESSARWPNAFYGHGDFFANALLGFEPAALERVAAEVEENERAGRNPEQVFYQATPVRQVLELIDRARVTADDVVFDLGAGIGKVAMLVNLLTGAKVVGVEIERAYSDYARARVEALGLRGVELRTQDARTARYDDATVVFMYHPFTGRLLDEVLERLRQQAERRPLRIGTLGRITFTLAQQSWLQPVGTDALGEHRAAVFAGRR
ncbi:MAG: hypothetical protein IRZ16_20565 [Myxococcaceae bacterium]|nr:hypothetical protein [Myxococcaceae bacterium]